MHISLKRCIGYSICLVHDNDMKIVREEMIRNKFHRLWILTFIGASCLTVTFVRFSPKNKNLRQLSPENMRIDRRLQSAYSRNDVVLIEPSHPDVFGNPTLVIFVQSEYTHVNERRIIRDTWARTDLYNTDTNSRVCVIFSLGIITVGLLRESASENEILVHRDILLLNVTDSYDNLSIKGLETMAWISRVFPGAEVLKTDDDIVLNVFAWLQISRDYRAQLETSWIVCLVWIKPLVTRDGKYAVAKDQYPHDVYPSFCSGAAYLMSPRAVSAILEASKYIPLFVRDDAYLTGIVARAAKVSLLCLGRNSFALSENDYFAGDFDDTFPLLVHGVNGDLWYTLWYQMVQNRYADSHIVPTIITDPDRGVRVAPVDDFIKYLVNSQH